MQTSEIQRHRISLLPPWRALRSLPPRPPPREVFSLCTLTPHPPPPSVWGERLWLWGSGTRSASGVSCPGDRLPSARGRGAEANQLFFELQNIIIPKRSCIYRGQKSLSLHIPGSGSLQDAGAAALGGGKKKIKSPVVSSNAGQGFAAQSRHRSADLKRFWG